MADGSVGSAIKRGSARLAVLSLLSERPLHGYEIAKTIEARSRGALRFSLASLYPLLYSMEAEGIIDSEWQETASGRRRRCYKITATGRKKLVPVKREWVEFIQALEAIAGFRNA